MDDDAAEDPAPAAVPAAAPAAAELEGDILQENPGYLLIYYGPETTSDDRFPLNLASCGSVLRELNNLAVGMDDFPLFESNEIALKGEQEGPSQLTGCPGRTRRASQIKTNALPLRCMTNRASCSR